MRIFNKLFALLFDKKERGCVCAAEVNVAPQKKYRVTRCDEPVSKPVFSPISQKDEDREELRTEEWEALVRVVAFGARREISNVSEKGNMPLRQVESCIGLDEIDDDFFAPLAALRGLNVAERFQANEQ